MAINLIDSSPAESSQQVLLHPLVLLTINDHCCRSAVRQQGPIIGALLGRHDGKSIVVEQAFECGSKKLRANDEGVPLVDAGWVSRMIKLQSEIYPDLVPVGWYTFGKEVQPSHLAIQSYFQHTLQCDSPIFLLFQGSRPTQKSQDGELPFQIYEGVEHHGQAMGSMDLDNDDSKNRFRPVSHSLETPADEAIGLADIMQTATAAHAIAETSQAKQKDANGTAPTDETDGLTAEEDELLSSLATKANAIKMLQSRLSTITAYLDAQPASYLTDSALTPEPGPDHEILRSISTLAASLTLTSPAGLVGYAQDTAQAQTDGQVVELLAQMTRHVGDIKQLGKHIHAADTRRRRDGPGTAQDAFVPV